MVENVGRMRDKRAYFIVHGLYTLIGLRTLQSLGPLSFFCFFLLFLVGGASCLVYSWRTCSVVRVGAAPVWSSSGGASGGGAAAADADADAEEEEDGAAAAALPAAAAVDVGEAQPRLDDARGRAGLAAGSGAGLADPEPRAPPGPGNCRSLAPLIPAPPARLLLLLWLCARLTLPTAQQTLDNHYRLSRATIAQPR